MNLKISVENRTKVLEVPDSILTDGEEFFNKMDHDMSQGWQMGPDYLENPDQIDRCKIAADKILVAIDTENEKLLYLMAGYILSRLPSVTGINIDTNGDIQNTELIMDNTHKLG